MRKLRAPRAQKKIPSALDVKIEEAVNKVFGELNQACSFDGPWINKSLVKFSDKNLTQWLSKIHEETKKGFQIIVMMPTGLDAGSEAYQEYALTPELRMICSVKSAIQQGPQIFGYNVDIVSFYEAFKPLGTCIFTSIINDPNKKEIIKEPVDD